MYGMSVLMVITVMQQNNVGILPEGWQMKMLLEVNYSSFEVPTATAGISQPIAHVIDIIWNK